ncbi:uncharacterized protein LOC121372271 [Gigantopelta aegis]|uniref:uncharacterized protein LOC121372271 n=1 Tax=Gigantopelta aegis TaxID=1735272 RepID=UPI001B88E36F|nr:uncharacterized protein LOC121372271 [Gigantopelta aegis]
MRRTNKLIYFYKNTWVLWMKQTTSTERVMSDAASPSAQANPSESSLDYSKKESLEVAGFPLWMILAIALDFLLVLFVVCLTLCLCIRCRKTKSAEITQMPEKLPIPGTMFTISAMPPKYESQGIHPLSYEEAKGESICAVVKKEE